MRLKKGFTLAEILIVLMVIGAIATMTVPSLMRGVTEAQWKTAYKKAYNTVLNIAAIERVSGISMTASSTGNVKQFYTVLYNNLSISGAAAGVDKTKFDKDTSDYTTATAIKSEPTHPSSLGTGTPDWLIGDDKIAYQVLAAGTCSTKAVINSKEKPADAYAAACVTVGVDTNGLITGPNMVDTQVDSTSALTAGTNMNTLVGERFYIYVGSDGVTAGHPQKLATGRIINDVK